MSHKSCLVTAALVVAAVALAPSRAAAQSLGDVAKKEGERRQGVKSTGKVLTNSDLPSVPPPSAAPPVDVPAAPADGGKPAADAKPADDKGAAAKDAKGAKDTGDVKDQKYWANRMKSLQEEQQRDTIFAESLQSRINGLTADFVNRDDPFQRTKIAKDRDAATKELDRVKKAITDRTKAIAELEEEARRAGVPAGWLR